MKSMLSQYRFPMRIFYTQFKQKKKNQDLTFIFCKIKMDQKLAKDYRNGTYEHIFISVIILYKLLDYTWKTPQINILS